MIAAAEAPKLRTRAVASIWAVAQAIAADKRVCLGKTGPECEPQALQAVHREHGVTRVMGAQYPANRWTQEREDQERARRARQVLPKPPKGARTKGRKLMDMIGGDDL